MKKNKKKRGGGRSVRYTQEGVRAADEMMGDLTAGRSALNEQSPYNNTLQDDLGSVVSQATDGTRLKRLANALAQVAIEYSRNPAANEGALSVYAEALNENTNSDSRRAILQTADQIVQESFPDGNTALPSTLFAVDINTVPDASTMDVASEPEMAGPMTRDEAIRQALRDIPAEPQEIAATMPVRAGAVPSPILTTPRGVAVALGDPTPNPERAAQAMQGVVGRSLLPMNYGFSGQFEAIRDTTPPLFQQYVTQPNEPFITADPTGENARRPYLDPATGDSYMASEGLLENLSEYPRTIPLSAISGGGRKTVTLDDRIALRRAQDINDQMEAAFYEHLKAGGTEEDFYNSPVFQQFSREYNNILDSRADLQANNINERPARLAELLGTGGLGNRPRGATVLESGSNPVAMYNPILAGIPSDTAFDAQREFDAIYGPELRSTLFSPNQYGIAIDDRARDVARNKGLKGMGFDRYEGGLAAFNNLVEAINAAAASRNLDLRFALSPNAPTTDLTGSQRLGNDVNAAILDYFAKQKYHNIAPLADADASSQRLSTQGVGMLAKLLAGQGMDTLPTGTIPVPTPDSILFSGSRGPALPYGGRVLPADIDGYEKGLERASMSPLDRAMESLLRAFSTDPRFARSGNRTVNPYLLFPQAARSTGIYFDPFNPDPSQRLGGAFIEGTDPRLPPELAGHLYANALRIQPSNFRDNVVSGLASGFNQGNIFGTAAAINAYNKPPLIPRTSLLNGLRLLPDSVAPNARRIIDEALERRGSAPPMPETGALQQGIRPAELPADNDLSALPSLYDVPNSSFALNRMSLPMRRGILGNLMTA